ncbi:MAG TPA: S4 domain-containing protein, partial [Elusimicrobiales bacterium]|nr:S4 domain-containing protein [Elusimicrobiales bacterium]
MSTLKKPQNEQIIDFDEEHSRLDIFLTDKFTDYSRNHISKLIKNGNVSVDGKIRKPSFILDKPSQIKIIFPTSSAK